MSCHATERKEKVMDIGKIISTPLLEQAHHELDFLSLIDQRGYFYKPEVVQASIYRYEKFWLPLLAEISQTAKDDERFLPPLDVHWVWHVHMLSPTSYAKDCNDKYGRILGHHLHSIHNMNEIREKTKVFWTGKYDQEPFELTLDEVPMYLTKIPDDYTTQLSYDIAEAAQRQKLFFYQVSLPHYNDNNFLWEGLERYKKFLYLKSQNKTQFLVPCYDMDLIWHTHQVHPSEYINDTMNILNMILPHDDSVNDRSDGSRLNNSYGNTVKLWHLFFKTSFQAPGAMYRGESSQGKLSNISQDIVTGLITHNVYELQMQEVKLDAIEREVPQKTSVAMKLHTYIHGKLNKTKTLVKENWTIGCGEPFQLNPDNICFDLSDSLTSKISLTIKETKGFASLLCCSPTIHIARISFGGYLLKPSELATELNKSEDVIILHPELQNFHKENKSFVSSDYQLQLIFKMRVKIRREPKTMVYGIMPGTFYETVMPQNAKAIWGPVPLRKLPGNEENKCHIVTHRQEIPICLLQIMS